jgi:Uma2 family endonuclease
MTPPARDFLAHSMTEQEYLDSEPYVEVKREYIDGSVYAMAGAKAAHNRISGNLFMALGAHLKGKPCQPYIADMKVKAGENYFYPDVLVECSGLPDESVFTDRPVLIVEVLSRSTRRMDEVIKRSAYRRIDTLQEFVLVEQDIAEVEVMRRSTGWQSEKFLLGDSFTLESVGLTLSVEDIYERVDNQDMREWLEKKARAAAEGDSV